MNSYHDEVVCVNPEKRFSVPAALVSIRQLSSRPHVISGWTTTRPPLWESGMRLHDPCSPARALYRALLVPRISTPSPPLLLARRSCRSCLAPTTPTFTLVCHFSSRRKTSPSPNRSPFRIEDHFVIDSNIAARRINLVDKHNQYQPAVLRNDVLRQLDRGYCLLQVRPGSQSEDAEANTSSEGANEENEDAHTREQAQALWPTCKIVTRAELHERHEKQQQLKARAAQGAVGGKAASKQLELTWVISTHDLQYRLKRLEKFLNSGKRVTIILTPKRRGKVASQTECETVMQSIEGAVKACDAKEIKREGKLGKALEIVFDGAKQ